MYIYIYIYIYTIYIYIYIHIFVYVYISLAKWAEYLGWETGIQSEVESYQRLKKWYIMPPCLTLGIIRNVSMVKWLNLRKGVIAIEKGAFWLPLTMVANFTYLYIYMYIYIYIYGFFFLFNGILTLFRLFNAKANLLEEQ